VSKIVGKRDVVVKEVEEEEVEEERRGEVR
jgi:hypothetical protein